ncbi:MAG: MFS transporter [Methyloceanibacter sp.]|jgi:MFS family permease|uniref:MFS transporter n=1 Tax=Methyloceanibacter sp. TaxID=1965321 RepID=UPI003C50560B
MSDARRGMSITALIIAGESVFLLPFVMARVFRPTLLEVFDLNNLELGTAFSVYGVVAMAAYFFGGPLADRFPARILLAVALVSTAAGGLVMMTVPSLSTLVVLYAYWGITTIALFWAPLIRATRQWGGEDEQGRAFGLLDGGRGLLAALMGSMMVLLFAGLLPADSETASLAERTEALRRIILVLSAVTCAAALLVLLALPHNDPAQDGERRKLSLQGVARVAAMPSVWLQAAIILCAYVGFKAIDDFSLYANQVVGLDQVDAAKAGVVSLWVRPFAAIGAGLLADRIGASTMTASSFAVLAGGSLVLASGLIGAGMLWMFLLTMVCCSMGIFALRGLYFAIMREGKIPMAYTGTAVGLVSVIGYTPDVFMGPLMGYLLDQSPGAAGHQHVFWVVTGFALLGLIASLSFARVIRKTD